MELKIGDRVEYYVLSTTGRRLSEGTIVNSRLCDEGKTYTLYYVLDDQDKCTYPKLKRELWQDEVCQDG